MSWIPVPNDKGARTCSKCCSLTYTIPPPAKCGACGESGHAADEREAEALERIAAALESIQSILLQGRPK
jgi:hypothetical protein